VVKDRIEARNERARSENPRYIEIEKEQNTETPASIEIGKPKTPHHPP
jgi:hypothetical protein